MNESAADVALRFNDCINSRDLGGLVDLMTADHVFVDSAGHTTRGRAAMANTWAAFFERFPDCRNIISRARSQGDSVILIG